MYVGGYLLMMPWHVLSAVGELLNLAKINRTHFVTISLPWWYIFEIMASNILLYFITLVRCSQDANLLSY